MQPLRSSPITGLSSLLRTAPPLCLALVLRFLRGLRLNRSLRIETTGSHVPYRSLYPAHATSMPVAARAVNRLPPNLSWSAPSLQFRRRLVAFDTSTAVRLHSSSEYLPDVVSPRLFPDAHHNGS